MAESTFCGYCGRQHTDCVCYGSISTSNSTKRATVATSTSWGEAAAALKTERDAALRRAAAAEQVVAYFTDGLTCFSCKVAWSAEIHSEPCDCSHRDTWPHEWIGKRAKGLSESLWEANKERDALAAELRSVRSVMAEQARLLRAPDRAIACSEPVEFFGEAERVAGL